MSCIALGPPVTGQDPYGRGFGLGGCQKKLQRPLRDGGCLVHELMEARDERRLRALQRQLAKVNLLIVDELGYAAIHGVVRSCCSKGVQPSAN